MASKNETVASVADRIRHLADNMPNNVILTIQQCNFIADRIEAAHNREVAELVKLNERLQAHFDGVIARKDAEIAELRDEVLRLKDVLADERAQHTAAEARKNAEIAELERRIKVAEDALEKIYELVDNRFCIDASLLVKDIIADALDAIREEGGVK